MSVAVALGTILAVVLGMAALGRAIRHTSFGMGLILVSFALSAAVGRLTSVSIGDTRVSTTDIVAGIILSAAVGRVLRSRIRGPQAVLLVVLATLLLSVARGLLDHGMGPALNDFRVFMRYFGTALYVSTVHLTPALLDRLGRMWTGFAVALLPLLGLRWMNRLMGLPIGTLDATYDAPIRVLDGPDSFFYAEALLVALPATAIMGVEDRRKRMLLAAVLVVVNLALNRRTAFAALVVGVAALAARNLVVRRQLGRIAVVGAALALALTLFLPSDDTLVAPTEGDVAQSTTDTGTLEWRIEGWQQLLAEHVDSGVVNILVGQPMGVGYERVANEIEVESNPHNWFLQMFLRTGAVGLISLLGLYALGILRLVGPARQISRATPSTFDVPTLWTLLVMEAVWYLAWQPHQLQGIVLGLTMAIVVSSPSRPWPGERTPLPVLAER